MRKYLISSRNTSFNGPTAKWALLLAGFLLVVAGSTGAGAQDEPAEAPIAAPTVDAGFGVEMDRATRSLVDPATVFAADVGKIYCLTRIRGLTAPTTVTHAWYHDGQAKARVSLKVGSSDWRTWSSKTILPSWTGNWELKVLDETGKVLGTFGFVVE